VNLALLENDVRLKYTHIPSFQGSAYQTKEQGRYEALVKINEIGSGDYGKYLLYKPTNDWVEENFSKESLAIVQEIAKEASTVYKLKNLSKKEQGFIPLEQSLKYRTGTDERQISKMRYMPGKDVCNAMGEMV
jgi:hypothetical protein